MLWSSSAAEMRRSTIVTGPTARAATGGGSVVSGSRGDACGDRREQHQHGGEEQESAGDHPLRA